ncbi:MAG: response regulator [Deltaproteobacteria bacterium]|nr:response regulator [Deltaproteobacteria bacterium]
MSQALRVLIVEDSENDALLLVRALRRAGYDVAHERVDTAEAMMAALARQGWDIVISDYSMPNFSGTGALDLLKKSGLDIPFIFVSGTIGEDTAVAAMKAGAQDYIMKGNLARLIPAIERELGESRIRRERHRAEHQVQQHRRRQAALHDINVAITSTLDLDKVSALLVEKIDQLLPYSATTVRLYNAAARGLEAIASRNLDEDSEADGSLARRVFDTKTPLMSSDLQSDPRLSDPEFFRNRGLVSYLGVPLMAKDEPLGVLAFYTKEEHLFADDEIEFLSTLAGHAAIAIQNCRLYEQIKQQALDLERANKVKDEFLSIMSHELKTPITVINGYARMIHENVVGETKAEQDKVIGKILGCSHELLSMVNSILDVTRLESQAIKADARPVRLGHLLAELRSDYDYQLDKDLVLEWDYPADLPTIHTDSVKLRQILQNLINNAVKFTDRGEVRVCARYLTETNTLELTVKDTGIGISPGSLPSIFKIFHQGDSSIRRTHGGIGLGLYIVQKFTDMLGGSVAVSSEPGKGSTFTVTIPCGS